MTTTKPVIYTTPSDVGISPADPTKFGAIGKINAFTVHHSAGPRATSKARAQALHRAYQQHHIDNGWGDIGYHFSLDDHGRIYALRSLSYKGAHTAMHNTGNVGFMVHGNYDYDELTDPQKQTLRWIFRGGFWQLIHVHEHDLLIRGHQEWPDNPTACPGVNLMRHLTYLRNTELP